MHTFLRQRTWMRIDDVKVRGRGGEGRVGGGEGLARALPLPLPSTPTPTQAAQQQVQDSVALARLEGLEGHARAAERRLAAGGGAPKKQRSA